MPTTALSSNLDELDSLLQDLSEARYSGHVEHYESVTETRSFSKAPPPPERSVSQQRSQYHHDPHQRESSLSSRSRELSMEKESRWEYRGQGIWENRDSDYEGRWSEEREVQPSPRPSVERERAGLSSANTAFSRKMSSDTGPGGASTATAELDDLMTSLNNFKMDGRNVDEPVIGGVPSLDAMLGDLQEDMSKQGVKTTQKGVCAACDKPIVGQVITALGRTWHPGCFACCQCNMELGTQHFFERDGKPFCEQCYHALFSPRCARCGGAILDKCISALDSTWHPECFQCQACGTQLGDDGFHERDNGAYCKDCYFGQFAPKCAGCNLPIKDNYISSLNQQWHPECFVCRQCGEPFRDGQFFEHEGFPYCETHYHGLRGSLCAGCHKPIQGRCITAMFRKFHPECFVCSFCLKQLNKGTFKEQGDKPYCHECFDRLFG